MKDRFYYQAKRDHLASRAAYKLEEVQQKYRLVKKGQTVLELGASPGGWTQLLQEYVGPQGKILAVDMSPLAFGTEGTPVEFIKADFTEENFVLPLQQRFPEGIGLILSDAAPKTTGIHFKDAAMSAELCMAALRIAGLILKPGGALFFKIFAGDENAVLTEAKRLFGQVKRLKPEASRKESREFYVLATDFKK